MGGALWSLAGNSDTVHGVSNTDFSVSDTNYGVSYTNYGVSNTKCGVSHTKYGVFNTEYGQERSAVEPSWKFRYRGGDCLQGGVAPNPQTPNPKHLILITT